MRAIFSLVFLDIPFLMARCWCSYAFGIIASSLLIKNGLGILHSAARIFEWSVADLGEEYPLIDDFLTTIDDNYDEGEEQPCAASASGNAPKQPEASEGAEDSV